MAVVELTSDPGGKVTLDVHVPLKSGRLHDRVVHTPGLRLERLERRVTNGGGALSREEIVDFSSSTHALPECTYVEVSMPFLISAQPFDKVRRSIYAWICDRFVAKV